MWETVKLHTVNRTATITMNRPERRNAFNSEMVQELTEAFQSLMEHDCRTVVLTSEGTAFSAGADLEYMKQIRQAGPQANIRDARALAHLLELIHTFPKPVVARVPGPAIGGGLGLIAACDIAIAKQGAYFAFSEVRLGLIPAVIGPYVVRKMGASAARRYMLTGDRFHAEAALDAGLIHQVVVQGDLDSAVRKVCESLAQGGPEALAACKELILRCTELPLDQLSEWTALRIAELRASEEGQAGMTAFLEKGTPPWQREG